MARSRRTYAIGAAVTVVVLVAAAVGAWWFLIRSTAPEEASIETAAETLEAESARAATEQIDGTWAVDGSVGSFDDFTGTWAGYRFDEQLANIGAATAVGRTPMVSGTMVIDSGKVSDVDVNVDLTTLKSDKDRRDQALHHRGLESDTYPMATFALSEPIELTRTSESVTTEAQGELTVHGVTKPVEVEVEARMAGGRIAVVGHAPLQLSAFGIQAPTGYSVLSIEDQGSFEFQIFFVPAPGAPPPSA